VVTYGLQVRGDGTGILPEGVEGLEYGRGFVRNFEDWGHCKARTQDHDLEHEG